VRAGTSRLGAIEEAGLITRAADDTDRRRVHAQLTAAGHAAFEQHAGGELRGTGTLLAALTADEQQVLAGLLRKLVLAAEPSRPSTHAPKRADGANGMLGRPISGR